VLPGKPEITLLSNTIPNWLRGDCSGVIRDVTLQNDVVPALLKLSRTSYWPVVPLWFDTAPGVASEISEPSTSAGPRMYLTGRSVSQVTIGLFLGSALSFATALRSAQLSEASCCSSSGVTSFGSLAVPAVASGAVVGGALGVTAVGAAEGLVVGAGVVAATSAGGKPDLGAVVAVPVAAGLLVAVPVGLRGDTPVGVGVSGGAAEASTSTARICSCEDFCRELTTAGSGVPGNETTMSLPPWVETSASVTPDPFTRARMMSTAFKI